MSISRSCRSCGSLLPDHLTDGTCPSCGSARAGHETPKASGTPADREGDFVLFSPNDPTGTHRPEPDLDPTVPAEPPAPRRSSPRVIPELTGYRDIAWLNGGGMGDVYSAVQIGTERRAAIKVMRPSGSNYSQNRDRFENEIRALGRVDHAGIVRVFECGECPQGPYFAMEFVAGETLAQRVRRAGVLEPHAAVGIVRQAAEAVHCAHAVDVLHRDIKPSNIMITPDGSVKVTDFGLAKHTDDTDEDVLTQTGMVIGTPGYLPPEQAMGKSDQVGPAADVYGLGGTLYYLLTAHPPHDIHQHRRTHVPDLLPVRSSRPDLCPILIAILEKSLARDPKDRYASAEQFAQELSNWSRGLPTIAVPPNRWQRLGRYARRHKVAAAFLVLLPFLAAAAAIVRRETDEKGRIERALARGETVTLIGETGFPKWHDWAALPGLLDRSPRGDDTCGLQSQRYSGLVLVDDPMNDHYRIRAEIRHLGGMRSGDLANRTTNLSAKIGLFWGRQKLVADGKTAETLFSLDFNDLTRNVAGNPNADDEPQKVRIHGRSFIELPDVGVKPHEVGLTAPKYFVSKNDRQGIWRGLVLEVHPEGCTAYWEEFAGEPNRLVTHISREELDAAGRSAAAFLASKFPADWRIPDWTPRRPLGVLSLLSTISIRNVTIEPLPSP